MTRTLRQPPYVQEVTAFDRDPSPFEGDEEDERTPG